MEREGRTALLSRAKAHPPEADTETWLEDAAWNQVGAEAEDSEDWTIMRGNYRRRFAVRVPRDSALPTDMRPADPQHGEPDVDVAQWGPGYGDNGPWGAAAPAQQWGGAYEEEWGGEGQGGGAGEGALQPYTAAVYPRYDWNNPEPWSQRADAVSAAVREITTLNLKGSFQDFSGCFEGVLFASFSLTLLGVAVRSVFLALVLAHEPSQACSYFLTCFVFPFPRRERQKIYFNHGRA